MKATIICPNCNAPIQTDVDEEFFDGKELTCSQGHKFNFYPQVPKYSLLFHHSLIATHNGYFQEAFQTLYSGYEVFKEFFVGAKFFSDSQDYPLTKEILKKINRSEKIDGAFTLAYTQMNGTLPKAMTTSMITDRNKIIHQGKLVDEKTLFNMGNWIFEQVTSILYQEHENMILKKKRSSIFLNYEYQKFIDITKNEKPEELGKTWSTLTFATTPITPNLAVSPDKDLFTRLTAQDTYNGGTPFGFTH